MSKIAFAAFHDELRKIKLASAAAKAWGVLDAPAGAVGRYIRPGGASRVVGRTPPPIPAAAQRNPLKQTQRGQTVPGLANVQRDYQSVTRANQELAGAQSIL